MIDNDIYKTLCTTGDLKSARAAKTVLYHLVDTMADELQRAGKFDFPKLGYFFYDGKTVTFRPNQTFLYRFCTLHTPGEQTSGTVTEIGG